MYCPKCGQELPADAGFCLKCGQPQAKAAGELISERRREVCKIELRERGAYGWWEARIGTTEVARSGNYNILGGIFRAFTFRNPDTQLEEKHVELISRLASEGWEPVSHDDKGHVVMMQRAKM